MYTTAGYLSGALYS